MTKAIKTKVQTSSSGRRFVDVDQVIRERLAALKKSRNGNGHKANEASGDEKRETPTALPANGRTGNAANP